MYIVKVLAIFGRGTPSRRVMSTKYLQVLEHTGHKFGLSVVPERILQQVSHFNNQQGRNLYSEISLSLSLSRSPSRALHLSHDLYLNMKKCH